jgi:hypothetical protein
VADTYNSMMAMVLSVWPETSLMTTDKSSETLGLGVSNEPIFTSSTLIFVEIWLSKDSGRVYQDSRLMPSCHGL